MRGILPNLLHLLKPSSEPGSSVPYLFWTLDGGSFKTNSKSTFLIWCSSYFQPTQGLQSDHLYQLYFAHLHRTLIISPMMGQFAQKIIFTWARSNSQNGRKQQTKNSVKHIKVKSQIMQKYPWCRTGDKWKTFSQQLFCKWNLRNFNFL